VFQSITCLGNALSFKHSKYTAQIMSFLTTILFGATQLVNL